MCGFSLCMASRPGRGADPLSSFALCLCGVSADSQQYTIVIRGSGGITQRSRSVMNFFTGSRSLAPLGSPPCGFACPRCAAGRSASRRPPTTNVHGQPQTSTNNHRRRPTRTRRKSTVVGKWGGGPTLRISSTACGVKGATASLRDDLRPPLTPQPAEQRLAGHRAATPPRPVPIGRKIN